MGERNLAGLRRWAGVLKGEKGRRNLVAARFACGTVATLRE